MTKGARKRPSRGKRLLWIVVLIAVAVLAPGPALLIAVPLCPALAALRLDRQPSRPTAQTMLLTGTASAAIPFGHQLASYPALDQALDSLGEPGPILLCWLGCLAGWLLSEVCQVASRLSLYFHSRQRVARLRRELADIDREWTSE